MKSMFCNQQKERDEKLLDGKPDEDGWVKVTRKGKNPSFTRSEANEVKIRAQLKRKQEKQKVRCCISYLSPVFPLICEIWVTIF